MRAPRGLPHDYHRLHADLIGAGFEFAGIDGQGHYAYRHKDRPPPVTLPGTPQHGRARTLANARATVRRAIRTVTL